VSDHPTYDAVLRAQTQREARAMFAPLRAELDRMHLERLLRTHTVEQLREQARARGLAVSGRKRDLARRLIGSQGVEPDSVPA
jgi:hypothetical protein